MSTPQPPSTPGAGPARAQSRRRVARVVVAALALLVCSAAAQAALGEAADSVLRDHAALRGTALKHTPAAGFEVHETTTPEGTAVRQYVSGAGKVFAATWSGPALPDLKLVLGSHYAQYAADLQRGAGNAKVVAMRTGAMVLRVVKLPRGMAGSAMVPALMPAGASVEDIDGAGGAR
ncbi:DUF2844 domain-containing protein [Ramlibacter sp.]|uniref:DUF2844 domain-containing protein n=1 Tax=Ramlibacter sp. TaxID=1917967 RepID=UPI002BCE9917|nr:DUF2844 domain-containing protein [Ramlibacter sp.]HWI83884.1 DUF2844 domain-containing protein [Ramlibacter sp.]